MTTPDEVAAYARSLPGSVESSHFDHADFRVGGKIFASFPDPDRLTIRLDPEHARILVASDPEAYIPHNGVWGTRGWTRIVLTLVDQQTVFDLIHDSWFALAPKRLREPASRRDEG